MSPAPTPAQRLADQQRPIEPVVMHQTWRELLFLHWRMDPGEIQKRLPAGLTVDTWEDEAWIGVVPFLMDAIRPRFCPALPWISYFRELNVRTYVHDAEGRPGVWFFSLDCDQPLAVWTARTFFHLPYQHARLEVSHPQRDRVEYSWQRRGTSEAGTFEYCFHGTPEPAAPGTLEFFLAERYRLFAAHPSGQIFQGRVHHTPYPLQPVEVTQWDNRLLALNGLPAPARAPDHAIGSRGVRVTVHALRPVNPA